MKDIHEQIRNHIMNRYISEAGNIRIGDDDSLYENGILDSPGFVELIGWLEEVFDITISADDMVPENLDSINLLIRYIQAKNGHPTGQS